MTVSSSSFSVAVAQVVALFVECILYGQSTFSLQSHKDLLSNSNTGVYLVSFAICLRILIFRKPHDEPYKFKMIAIALLMFLFATLDVAFGLRLNLDAFVYHNDIPSSESGTQSGVEVAAKQFDQISYWMNVMRFVDCLAQMFIGDGILVSSPTA